LDLRIHHAIFYITEILDALTLDRVLGAEGNPDGYTSLSDLVFTPENLGVACKWTKLMTIGKATWVHGIAFKEYRFIAEGLMRWHQTLSN